MCRKYRAASGLTGALCWDERWGCNSPLELQVSQGLGAEEREMGQHALVGGVGRGDGGLTDATARGTSPWHLPCGSWPPALNLEPTGGGHFHWSCSSRESEGRLQILVAVPQDPYFVAQAMWYLENSVANPSVCFWGSPGCLAPEEMSSESLRPLHGAGLRLRLLYPTVVALVL